MEPGVERRCHRDQEVASGPLSTTRPSIFRWIALGLIAILTTSCGDSSDATTTALDGPVMRYPEPASRDDREDAEVRGRPQLDGDCLYLAPDELDERYPVVWPAGTTWDADNESVISPSGSGMPVGGDVYGGGGYY